MHIVMMLAAFLLYLIVGLMACWWVDSRPRWWRQFDGLSTVQQWCVLVWWPLAIPLCCALRSRRHGRR